MGASYMAKTAFTAGVAFALPLIVCCLAVDVDLQGNGTTAPASPLTKLTVGAGAKSAGYGHSSDDKSDDSHHGHHDDHSGKSSDDHDGHYGHNLFGHGFGLLGALHHHGTGYHDDHSELDFSDHGNGAISEDHDDHKGHDDDSHYEISDDHDHHHDHHGGLADIYNGLHHAHHVGLLTALASGLTLGGVTTTAGCTAAGGVCLGIVSCHAPHGHSDDDDHLGPAMGDYIGTCSTGGQVCCFQYNVVKVKKVIHPVRRRRRRRSRRRHY